MNTETNRKASMSNRFRVTFNAEGREQTQLRPGPTADKAAERVTGEYARRGWGAVTILKVEPV